MPPVFRQKIEPLEINVGGTAKFECEVEDAPNVAFKWYKSGIEIKQSDKFRILSRQNSSSLELLNPVKADSSEYTCKASNQHGTVSCTASLVVTGKTPPVFLGDPLVFCIHTFLERERELYKQFNKSLPSWYRMRTTLERVALCLSCGKSHIKFWPA